MIIVNIVRIDICENQISALKVKVTKVSFIEIDLHKLSWEHDIQTRNVCVLTRMITIDCNQLSVYKDTLGQQLSGILL